MKKGRFINRMSLFLVMTLAFGLNCSCSDNSDDNNSGEDPAIPANSEVFRGKDYTIAVPQGTKGIECNPLGESEADKLTSSGYNFIATPVSVTQDGDDHVELERMATVSFNIPSDISEADRLYLLGVLITDDGAQYFIPDPYGVQDGYVRFETSHFCKVGAVNDKSKAVELFIERTAVSGWQANMSEADMKKTVKESIMDAAEDVGLGKNDFLGIAAREVFGDNEFLSEASDLIDAYDASNLTSVATEKIVESAKAKMLSVLFGKLKKIKEEGGKSTSLVETLEEHLTKENMETVSARLGNGDHAVDIAWDYAKSLVEDRLKDLSTKLVPQVATMQAAARAMKVIKQFWASNEMADMYETYKKYAESDGTMHNDDWNTLFFRRANAAVSKFGLTEAEIRKQFETRYKNEIGISKRKSSIRSMIDLWETEGLMEDFLFSHYESKTGEKMDYIQRLTRIHNLMERFRGELVKDGMINGKMHVDRILCDVVYEYLSDYPDYAKFYKWMVENGYYEDKFKKNMDGLDGERAWWLVRTDINLKETEYYGNTTTTYSATATQHVRNEVCTTKEFEEFGAWYYPYNATFTGTIDAAPAYIEGGDTLLLHSTLSVSSIETGWYISESASLIFDREDVGMGGAYVGYIKAEKINIKGSDKVGIRYGEAKSGEWDFKIRLPRGSKGDLKALNYDACGSRTHWVYKWCSIFEKDEE